MLTMDRKDFAAQLERLCSEAEQEIKSLFKACDITALVMYEEGRDELPDALTVCNGVEPFDIELRAVVLDEGGRLSVIDEDYDGYPLCCLNSRTDVVTLYGYVADRLQEKEYISLSSQRGKEGDEPSAEREGN